MLMRFHEMGLTCLNAECVPGTGESKGERSELEGVFPGEGGPACHLRPLAGKECCSRR